MFEASRYTLFEFRLGVLTIWPAFSPVLRTDLKSTGPASA